MEIIHAKIAYSNTLMAEVKSRQSLFKQMVSCFNDKVRVASNEGRTVCSLLWKEFDLDESYATDCEATAELLNTIIGAGYEAEFCYNGRTVCNPCGIVVAWGPCQEESIADFFNYSENLFRGE